MASAPQTWSACGHGMIHGLASGTRNTRTASILKKCTGSDTNGQCQLWRRRLNRRAFKSASESLVSMLSLDVWPMETPT